MRASTTVPTTPSLTKPDFASPPTTNSMPGQAVGVTWRPSGVTWRPSGHTASSLHQAWLWKSHGDSPTELATNTPKLALGTKRPPNLGDLLQPAPSGPTRLIAIADWPRSWKGGYKNVPPQWPNVWSVFLTENRSSPCDRLFLGLKSPCLYGELVN